MRETKGQEGLRGVRVRGSPAAAPHVHPRETKHAVAGLMMLWLTSARVLIALPCTCTRKPGEMHAVVIHHSSRASAVRLGASMAVHGRCRFGVMRGGEVGEGHKVKAGDVAYEGCGCNSGSDAVAAAARRFCHLTRTRTHTLQQDVGMRSSFRAPTCRRDCTRSHISHDEVSIGADRVVEGKKKSAADIETIAITAAVAAE
jgi:hypothetical protein